MEFWNPRRRVGLIDGDIILYAAAWVGDKSDTPVASYKAARDNILNVREALDLDDYRLYLTGYRNYRKTLDPTYKAQRKEQPKPRWLNETRDYLTRGWNGIQEEPYEADDLIGIDWCNNPDVVICSIDKDFRQFPAWLFNWRKYTIEKITPRQAEYNFWLQMLMGDKVDNVKGCPGIGEVKAKRILDNTKWDIIEAVVRQQYHNVFPNEVEADYFFDLNKKLLTILTTRL